MNEQHAINYAHLDRPEVLSRVFHPRPEQDRLPPVGAQEVLIPVEDGIHVGACFHMQSPANPNILFFHGNGEIVADYDELAALYHRIGINFMPVDYRGYGRSNGNPTVTTMMRDCHVIYDFVRQWLADHGYDGPLLIMGRSLGSASALALANAHQQDIAALIIDSGFAWLGPLLQLLGLNLMAIDFREQEGLTNIEQIKTFEKPVLIIHAQFDHIIPFADGQALHDACPSKDKTLLQIPGANHNDIFLRGLTAYMRAIETLIDKITAK